MKITEKISESTLKTYKSMIYIPGFSERILNSNIYDRDKVNIAFKTENTTKTLFSNTKDKLDNLDKSNLIYQIPCNGDGSNACDKIYVGTTKSKLRTRLAAHKSDYKRRGTLEQKTALAAHCARHSHSPNIESASILQQESNYKKRYTIEMLHIINTPATKRINYKADTEKCAHIYRHIIEKHRQK